MNLPTVTHLGGEKTVTGSCHLLSAAGLHILIDCGLIQGNDTIQPMTSWPVAPDKIDYLFLTHAHNDHIGRLPELLLNGFHGEIICSHPTRALLLPMLTDAMSFGRLEKAVIKNLTEKIEKLSWSFEYQQEFRLPHGISFKLGRAGHILGSAFIRFSFPADNQTHNYSIIFSGDIGNSDTPILPDPDSPDSCDMLLLESTYGNRMHESRKTRINRLSEKLERALADNGKVFIPAFALGRTQEILFELDRLFTRKEWREKFPKSLPVFVDSPLGLKITEIYSELSQFWDAECKQLQAAGDHPFDFDNLYGVEKFKDHKALLEMDGSAIIIAGSGMCTGGRIIDHLKRGLPEQGNDIFFVGYQAKGTPGDAIVKNSKTANSYVRLDNEQIPIKANIEQLTGYSAHADQAGLIKWVESMPNRPRLIKLIHGEPEAQTVLAAELTKRGYSVSPQYS